MTVRSHRIMYVRQILSVVLLLEVPDVIDSVGVLHRNILKSILCEVTFYIIKSKS